MSKRRRLIRKWLLVGAVPVVLAAAALVVLRRSGANPYVPGGEEEGITRSLERSSTSEAAGIRFTDVAEAAGIHFRHFPFRRTSQLPEDMASGAAWGDYDADGYPDLFVVNFAAPVGASDAEMGASGATDRLFHNRGDGTFEDVTAAAGVGAGHRGMGAAWGDYDGDGDLDLVVTSWGENILWENRGDGTFGDVTAAAGIRGTGFWTCASWSDFDLDGDLDLYVCGYVEYTPEEPGSPHTRSAPGDLPFTLNPSSYPPQRNLLYVNQGDGTFRERAREAGVLGDRGRSLSAAWVDLDEDGYPDLYVANDVSDNLLYRNLGDGTFEDLSYPALVADYRGAMGVGVADWDGDLDLDLFITHWIAQENALYSNQLSDLASDGERSKLFFGDDADRVGLGQISLDLIGWGTTFVDVDNDGLEDLFVANGSTFQERSDPALLIPMDPHLYRNRGPERGFFEVGAQAGIRTDPPGVGRGAAAADYDQDGDADLVVVRFGEGVRLLRNDSRTGHSLTLRLRGRAGHGRGFGSRVLIHAGGRTLLRAVGAGAPYLSQNGGDLLVGLGGSEQADSVEVTWPGGHRDVWRALGADRVWVLAEGGAATERARARPSRSGAPPDSVPPRTGRRTSGRSPYAVRADAATGMTREETRRFWTLNRDARRRFNGGDWAGAASVFREMLELNPSHLDTRYDLGNCLLEMGRYDEALEAWRGLLEANPASARAWIQIGVLHTLPGAEDLFDLEAAMSAFRHAHDLNREESRSLSLLGEAALARGDLDAAEEALETSRRMNAQVPVASYLRAYLAWKRGDADAARALLNDAASALERPQTLDVPGEGDVRSDTMMVGRRRAARRRLFASCLEALPAAEHPLDPGEVLPCVDRTISELPGGR